jgi:nucleoside-triphosphatase
VKPFGLAKCRPVSKHILLTGRPGCGKTTVIRSVVQELTRRGVRVFGFWTDEIREKGRRVGFRIELVSGEKAIMAHENFSGGPRVSRYGVDVSTVDRLAAAELERASAAARCVVCVDEIGKMELCSQRFREALAKLLDSGTAVVATIIQAPYPHADRIKERRDVELLRVTAENRASLPALLADRLINQMR